MVLAISVVLSPCPRIHWHRGAYELNRGFVWRSSTRPSRVDSIDFLQKCLLRKRGALRLAPARVTARRLERDGHGRKRLVVNRKWEFRAPGRAAQVGSPGGPEAPEWGTLVSSRVLLWKRVRWLRSDYCADGSKDIRTCGWVWPFPTPPSEFLKAGVLGVIRGKMGPDRAQNILLALLVPAVKIGIQNLRHFHPESGRPPLTRICRKFAVTKERVVLFAIVSTRLGLYACRRCISLLRL